MGQKKQRKGMQWIFVFGMSLCLLLLAVIPDCMVYAATEPTYELTEETKEVEAYIGTVVDTSSLNVRTGFGSDFDKVKVNGSTVILSKGDKVAIMSSGKSSGGSTWYEVRWMKNGTEYHGYVSGKYIKVSEERAMPLPTPTPEATPTPEPTPTPEATPTPEPTPTSAVTPTPTPMPKEEKEGFKIWEGILLVILILLLLGVIYVLIMMKKREMAAAKTTDKIDNLKNVQLKKQPNNQTLQLANVVRRDIGLPEGTQRQVRRPKEDIYEQESAMLARKEQARIANEKIVEKSRFFDPAEEQKEERELQQLSESLKEKEVLKEEIDSLRPGDIVYHEFFGKGVVFDNSDVKRIEIRFGTDVRFIDKASCVAKRLMHRI